MLFFHLTVILSSAKTSVLVLIYPVLTDQHKKKWMFPLLEDCYEFEPNLALPITWSLKVDFIIPYCSEAWPIDSLLTATYENLYMCHFAISQTSSLPTSKSLVVHYPEESHVLPLPLLSINKVVQSQSLCHYWCPEEWATISRFAAQHCMLAFHVYNCCSHSYMCKYCNRPLFFLIMCN